MHTHCVVHRPADPRQVDLGLYVQDVELLEDGLYLLVAGGELSAQGVLVLGCVVFGFEVEVGSLFGSKDCAEALGLALDGFAVTDDFLQGQVVGGNDSFDNRSVPLAG